MKHLIKIKNSNFNVSNSVVSAITKNNLNFKVNNYKGKQVYLLDDSCFSFFTTIPTTSPTYYFIKVCNSTKLRVNKLFFDFVVLYSKQHNIEKAHNLKPVSSLYKFYTKSATAQSCVSNFLSRVPIQKNDLIIEPSSGDGSFLKPLKSIKCNKIFLDIAPENKQIKQANFLEWQPPKIKGKIHVIGNPPFGKQASLCQKFINHASKFADSISFILPASYNRASMTNKVPLNFQLTLSKDLETESCLNTKANCVFQI